jgi:hypothetical protein
MDIMLNFLHVHNENTIDKHVREFGTINSHTDNKRGLSCGLITTDGELIATIQFARLL